MPNELRIISFQQSHLVKNTILPSLCKPQILNENYSCKPNLVGFTTETSKDLKID